MPSLIQARMASSAEMLAIFGDAALIAHALAFEAAQARWRKPRRAAARSPSRSSRSSGSASP
ncbi:MAG: hypothetical protein ACHQAY_19630 [Hyphomicrobiales bacterium]